MSDKLEALSQPVAWTDEVTLLHMGDRKDNYFWPALINPDDVPFYSQEYVTALIQRAVAAELREKETSARAAQADLWAKALVELDEKMKEAARILKSGERLALSRAIKILEGQDDD